MNRLDIFNTWQGKPDLKHSELITLAPKSVTEQAVIEEHALWMLDDGVECLRPAIEEVIPEFGPTVDYDISVNQWLQIMNIWREQLSRLEKDGLSENLYDHPPYGFERILSVRIDYSSLSIEQGIAQYRLFHSEVSSYIEQWIELDPHITLTGL